MGLPEYNPYQFVPFPTKVPRAPLGRFMGHDRVSSLPLLSGKLVCQLNVRTSVLAIARDDRQPTKLPASSLRGMLRSVAEIVGQGCGSFIGKDGLSWEDKKPGRTFRTTGEYPDPTEHVSCSEYGGNPAILERFEQQEGPRSVDWSRMVLCRPCAMFGFAHKQACWRGRIQVGDGTLVRGEFGEPRLRQGPPLRMDGPRPHHLPHYFEPPWEPPEDESLDYEGGVMLGRKVYRHNRSQRKVEVENMRLWELPGDLGGRESSVGRFEVCYENLSGLELGLLLYVLDLKRGASQLDHRYGYGKPAGYGSVRILPQDKIAVESPNRYRGFDSLPLARMRSTPDEFKQLFFAERPATDADWQAFEKWMQMPLSEQEFRYPTRQEMSDAWRCEE